MNAAPNTAGLREVGKLNFDEEVLRSQQPVLVAFWAPWSTACRLAEPVLNALMCEISGEVRFAKVNADENPHLSLWYGIQCLPTLLYFVDGTARARIVGIASKEAILAQLLSFKGNSNPTPISKALNENKSQQQ